MNVRQLRFAQEYALSGNATHAAVAAGYSKSSAPVTGMRLLDHPDVREEIDRMKKVGTSKMELTQERVLAEIMRMAFLDVGELATVSEDGKTLMLNRAEQIRELPEDVRRAIVGWKHDSNGNLEVKLSDKSKALDQLARHLTLYNDKVEVELTGKIAERLRRGRERVSRGED